MAQPPSEAQHEEVYGKTFALYDKQQLLEFMRPFEERFAVNGIAPREAFGDKACLDAGCGGGRGSIFMLRHGARHVTAFDYSPTNVETTQRNARLFDFSNISLQRGTLAELPFPDDTFDVVWCNGVLQHAAEPDRCLQEITRVLKTGGRAWIYVYGAGGVYWYAIRRFRELFRELATNACIAALRLLRCETRYVAEYIDDWKVDFLRTYTNQDMSRRLAELGFADTTPLKYGTSYDTSHRINLYPADRVWLGDGDLRYWTLKSGQRAPGSNPLSAGECGSEAAFAPEILSRFAPLFDAVAREVADDRLLGVALAANIQRELRDLLSTTDPFEPETFAARVERALEWARAWRSGSNDNPAPQ